MAALAFGMQPFGNSWATALAGGVVGFGFLLLFYVVGIMGAGDVKFAGALGLWVGLSPLAPIWIGASLLAGVHGVLWLILRRWPVLPRLALMLLGERKPLGNGTQSGRVRFIPYAAYLSLATVAWMLWGRQS
ncbi:UNVERIFIED_ORG: prepilin peptidase CpaA [Variovorax guangxiensis]